MDLKNNILVKASVAPISPSASGTLTGTVVDRHGYHTVTFVISTGAQGAATTRVMPIVKEGSVTGTMTSAADTVLLGTESAANDLLKIAAGEKKSATIGYIGTLRYVSCDLNVTGATTGVFAVQCILSDPRKAPVTQA